MIKLTAETPKLEFIEIADLLVKETSRDQFGNLYDFLCFK
jgi:hypothetical protein